MSSKKEIRRKRREREQEEKDAGGRNPALLFVLGIAAAILITVGAFFVLGNPGGPGDPPWPGAVWSAEHGHWH
jgi:hypothetical protein